MADDLRIRTIAAIKQQFDAMPGARLTPIDIKRLADAAITARDPIDPATGLTWKERFLERAERCAQAEVERDTIKARYATPAGHPHRTPQEWAQLLDGRDGFIVEKGLFAEFVKSLPRPTAPDKRQAKEPWDGEERRTPPIERRKYDQATPVIQQAKRVLDRSEIDYLLGFTDKDGNELTAEQKADLDKRRAAMYPPDGGLPEQVRDIEDVPSLHEVVTAHFKAKADKRQAKERRVHDAGGVLYVLGPCNGIANRRAGDRRQPAQPETSEVK